MKLQYFFIGFLLLLICSSDDIGCANNANDTERHGVLKQQEIYNNAQPAPFYDWSFERDLVIQLYNAKEKAVSTWSVVVSNGTGEVLYAGPSVGFPIPADTQLTNPLQLAGDYRDSSVIEQAEPNGLFTSKNTDATYIMIPNDDGTICPAYFEAKVLCWPYPVHLVNGMWERVPGSVSSITLTPHTTNPNKPAAPAAATAGTSP